MNMKMKQSEIFAFIKRHKQAHDGNAPTLREIRDVCGLSSTSVVNYCLDNLEDAGLIRRPEKGASRGIEVVGGRWLPPKRSAPLPATQGSISIDDYSGGRIF